MLYEVITQGPEEVGVLLFARGDELSLRRDDVHGSDRVARPAEPAALLPEQTSSRPSSATRSMRPPRRLLSWGSIYPEKGVETVLSALARGDGEISLQLLGKEHDPHYRARLEELVITSYSIHYTKLYDHERHRGD